MTQLIPAVKQEMSLDRIGEVFYKSGMFPDIKGAAQAIVKIMAGRELGFPPIYSMTKIAVVKGRVTVGAEAIAALVKRSGEYDYQVTKHSRDECIIQFTRGGVAIYTSTFTLGDANLAGLVKTDSGWEKFPRAMLFSRAISQGARIACPHLISGVYTHEEMGAEVTEEGELLSMPIIEPGTLDNDDQDDGPPGPREHWCEQHRTIFFKRGQMKGYAHPIKDNNGQTTGWCNEPTDAPPESHQTSVQGQGEPLKPKMDTRFLDYRPFEAMADIARYTESLGEAEDTSKPALTSDENTKSVLGFLGQDSFRALRKALILPATERGTATRGAMTILAHWLKEARDKHGDPAVLAAVDGIIAAHQLPKEEELFPLEEETP